MHRSRSQDRRAPGSQRRQKQRESGRLLAGCLPYGGGPLGMASRTLSLHLLAGSRKRKDSCQGMSLCVPFGARNKSRLEALSQERLAGLNFSPRSFGPLRLEVSCKQCLKREPRCKKQSRHTCT